jgi:hypothetical protein
VQKLRICDDLLKVAVFDRLLSHIYVLLFLDRRHFRQILARHHVRIQRTEQTGVLFLQILHLFVHQNDSSATLDEVFGFHVNFREQPQAIKRQNKIEQVLPTLSDTVAVVVAQIGDAFQGQASFDVRPEGYGAVVGPLDVVESCEFCEGLNQHVEVFGHAEMRGYESALLEACHGFFVDRLFLGFVENERESGHDGGPDEAKQFLVELTTVDVVVEAIFGDALAKEDLPKVVFSDETRLFGWHYYFFVPTQRKLQTCIMQSRDKHFLSWHQCSTKCHIDVFFAYHTIPNKSKQ